MLVRWVVGARKQTDVNLIMTRNMSIRKYDQTNLIDLSTTPGDIQGESTSDSENHLLELIIELFHIWFWLVPHRDEQVNNMLGHLC